MPVSLLLGLAPIGVGLAAHLGAAGTKGGSGAGQMSPIASGTSSITGPWPQHIIAATAAAASATKQLIEFGVVDEAEPPVVILFCRGVIASFPLNTFLALCYYVL